MIEEQTVNKVASMHPRPKQGIATKEFYVL